MTIYLDHNASALPLPAAVDAAAAWLARGGNPSSVHARGRAARAAVERGRRQIASAVGASPGAVVLTSGATEALHLAIGGLLEPGDHVVVSAVEHPAVFGACRAARAEVSIVAVDAAGRLSPSAFAAACRPETRLVVAMAAQNEVGTVYPTAEIAAAVAPHPLLCDAVQAWGRIPFDVGRSGAALAVLSSHKIGGPRGAGALWVRDGVALRPWLDGGPQERGRRAGTEDVAAIAGFGVAAEAVCGRLAAMSDVARRRDRLADALAAIPGFVEHGDPGARLPNTLAGRIDGVEGEALLAALDLEGIEISSGSACSAGSVLPSPVLLAHGLDAERARQGLRFSLGPETTDAEIERVATLLPRLVERIREADLAEVG
jgi:cysteine desulfurase